MGTARPAEGDDDRRSWAAWLEAASDEQLTRLLGLRPDLARSDPESFDVLAELVMARTSLLSCLDQLDLSARQILEGLCVLVSPVPESTLAEALGCGSEPLRPTLDGLAAAGLVLLDRETAALAPAGATPTDRQLVINPGLRATLRWPAGLGAPGMALLGERSSSELGDIARRLGLGASGAKRQLAAAITSAISDPKRVTQIVAHGPPHTAELVERLAFRGPVLEVGYLTGRDLGRHLDSPIGWLLGHGLIVASTWGVAEMPREAGITLRGGHLYPGFSPGPPASEAIPVDQRALDTGAVAAAQRLVADLATLLDAWSDPPAKQLRDGGIGVREVRRIAKLTARSETGAAWLADLAAVAGLASPHPAGDIVLPTPDYDRWLATSFADRWLSVASAWLVAERDLNLAGAPDEDDKPLPALLPRGRDTRAARRRAGLLDVLGASTPGEGLGPEQLPALVYWRAPTSFQAGGPTVAVTLEGLLDEARLLGIVTGVGPVALSSFGRALATGEEGAARDLLAAGAPPVVTEIVVQADLTAIAAGELEGSLRAELELLADIESTGAATVYRFSDASLRRGFDAGRRGAGILELLARHAPRGVPQALTYLVEDLDRRFGQLRVGEAGCYVRSQDTALLAELLRAKKTAKLALRELAPTVLVSAASPSVATVVLRAGGYLAAEEETDGCLAVRRPPERRAPATTGFGRPEEDPSTTSGVQAMPGDPELLALLPGGEGLAPVISAFRRPGGARDLTPGRGPLPPAELIARLRSRPLEKARSRRATRTASAAGAPSRAREADDDLLRALFDDEDRRARPDQIARGHPAMSTLFELAGDEEWVVRVCYRPRGLTERECNALVLETTRGRVVLEDVEDGTTIAVRLDQVIWARVLTEAEEENL